MAKLTLDFEPEYDFLLAGISCHMKDYRFIWALSKHLGIEFFRNDDFELIVDKAKNKSKFSLFSFEDEENHTSYFILANRGDAGILIPEMKQIDYFLQIRGPLDEDDLEKIISKIKKMSGVLTAFSIDPYSLKSGTNLLF
ncbi:MAG: IPExxxVDY family protein [Flavobacteriales bacterium]